MNSIHILLSLLFVHIATAQSGHGIDNSHGHSLNKRGAFAPGGDGVCYTYTIQRGDTCTKLAERYKVTTDNIETWNSDPGTGQVVRMRSKAISWVWCPSYAGCSPTSYLWSPSSRDKTHPGNYADLASLNPCPKGQCATTSKATTPKTTATSKTTKKADIVTLTSIRMVSPPSKTTTSTTRTPTWQMTIYEDENCKGDYFSVQGHEDQNIGNCIILAEHTATKVSDTTTSCRWWSDGGLNWDTCASSKVRSPKSFFITSGRCYVYSGKKCRDEDWIGETYGAFKGRQDHKTGYLSLEVSPGVHCSALSTYWTRFIDLILVG
ncbi:unnamed protein product [Penicillium egyptiacum]|uniref:LysM domain-containing protein n=1 Tax=Penicillium egyptiacum TaxID=1303716 RepID=A0A9W4K6M4_9EURO|nr:unnamed protein product [Penicillium egyptiacum]